MGREATHDHIWRVKEKRMHGNFRLRDEHIYTDPYNFVEETKPIEAAVSPEDLDLLLSGEWKINTGY